MYSTVFIYVGLLLLVSQIKDLHMKGLMISIVFLVFLSSSCKSPQAVATENEVSIENKFAFDFVNANSLEPVLDKAGKEGKLVFLDIYTTWCLPCKMMEDDVFTHQPTADIINENFISYKVDAEEDNGINLAFIYDIKSYPTLLFLDPDGNVLERKDGAAYHTEIIALADNAKSKYPPQ